jgi:hypothetical protein
MHLGIAMMMGMVLFGAIMIILNLAAFWPCEERIEAGVASANQRLPQNMAQA